MANRFASEADAKYPESCDMTREEATAIVAKHEFRIDQYRAVSHASCVELLGETFAVLLRDPIRKLGPTKDTVYPWNVIDYLVLKTHEGI